MTDSSDDAEHLDCETLSSEPSGRVLLASPAQKEFWNLAEKDLARLVNLMDLWAEGVPLHKSQFRNEGRCGGESNRILWAFKSGTVRAYGIVLPLEAQRTFAVIDIEPAKKKAKAEQHVLKRAYKRAIAFEEKNEVYL